MIKLSILWDEKKLKAVNSEEVLREMDAVYYEFQKELAVTPVFNSGSIFIGMATESDSELIKNLLNLPSELRSKLLVYIQNHFKTDEFETKKDTISIENENEVRNEKLKNLFFASPHKDIEILFDRQVESGRDIQV